MSTAGGSALLALALLLPLACTSLSAQEDRSALIVDPTEQSRAELVRVVSAALNDAPVTIAPDALTRDSVLTIERQPLRDLAGLPAAGRVLGVPEQFRLVTNGSRCVLVRKADGARMPLTATRCRAAATDP
jgi:hypothetical protein